jgi:hypothetical protein
MKKHFLPQIKDFVSKYSPAFIFADGDWDMPDSKKWRSEEFLAWLYNESPCKSDVVVNDRWGGVRAKHGDIYKSEYGGGNFPPTHPWQEDRGMGASYGYNRNEDIHDYNTRGQLLQMLAKCAGNGGNLLLNVDPTAMGEFRSSCKSGCCKSAIGRKTMARRSITRSTARSGHARSPGAPAHKNPAKYSSTFKANLQRESCSPVYLMK